MGLRYTQRGCSELFGCGRPLRDAIDEFVRGSDPAELPWCVLSVIRRAGLLLSVDNRRLFAMQEAQRRIRELDPAKVLYARVKLYDWLPVFDRFCVHLDHRCAASDGKNIHLREAKRH